MPRTPAEIVEALVRGSSPLRGTRAIGDLQHNWERSEGAATSFIDFIPIRLVTIIENSVREVVATAVDHGQPYISQGLPLIAKFPVKAIAETLLPVGERRITLGHLVSHSFSTGRLDEIIGALTTIFGDGFRNELATSPTLYSEDEDQDLPPIITDFAATACCLDRLLQIRHILVHELPRERPYVEQEIPQFFLHSTEFITALEWILIGKLYGSVPKSQHRMTMEARESWEEAEAELAALRGGKAEDFVDPNDPLAEREYHWDRFCDLSARIEAGYTESDHPGSMAPMIYAAQMAHLTRWRIRDIRRLKSDPEGHL
jgi:hypothetical protein